MPYKDPEKRKEYDKKYREQNREKIKETKKIYREKNKEKRLEYEKKNREKILEQQKNYYEKNKEKILEYQKKYKKKWRENNMEKRLEYEKKYREENHMKVMISNWKYRGLKSDDYESVYNLVMGTEKCDGCDCILTDNKPRTSTSRCMDHDHETGEFRAVLCHSCNLKQPRQKVAILLKNSIFKNKVI